MLRERHEGDRLHRFTQTRVLVVGDETYDFILGLGIVRFRYGSKRCANRVRAAEVALDQRFVHQSDFFEVDVSVSSKSHPRMIRMPTVVKY